MKLISVNIEVNRHYDTVLPFLKKENPDVACIQELLEKDFIRFKTDLNMEAVFQVMGYVTYPPPNPIRGERYGVAIFAKRIADSGYNFFLGSGKNIEKPFPEFVENRYNQKTSAFVWADIQDDKGKVFKFINTHLPVTKKGEVTSYQLEAVGGLLKSLESMGEFVLCGDTNAPRGLESFDKIAGKYKDNIPVKYKTSIDLNLHRVKRENPENIHQLADKMVDGLFTTPSFEATEVKLVEGVSDHQAIVAEIQKKT